MFRPDLPLLYQRRLLLSRCGRRRRTTPSMVDSLIRSPSSSPNVSGLRSFTVDTGFKVSPVNRGVYRRA
jgi:hypothetical protein